jgi:Tol biopolymer transport system component
VLFPILSQDGMQVAFATAKKDSLNAHLYVANYDGSGLSLITQEMNAHSIPAFNGYGSTITYYEINVYNQDSTVDSTGHHYPGFAGASWISSNEPNGNIYINPILINPGTTNTARISWRNGINMIAYVDNNQTFYQPYAYNQNRNLIDNGNAPLWSPDGTELAYDGLDNHIYMTWDLGATKTDLTGANQQLEAISEWSLASDKILCTSWTGTLGKSAASLKQVNVNTQQTTTIASPAYFGYYLK